MWHLVAERVPSSVEATLAGVGSQMTRNTVEIVELP